ncbi:MAG: EAL domain-containing protein [Zoogloeaceae bacterium]|nr:EAL domain-containing protein [Zoogloeaceae bacterium]
MEQAGAPQGNSGSILARLRRRLQPASAAADSVGSQVLALLVDNLEGMVFRCILQGGRKLVFISPGCLHLTGFEGKELTQGDGARYPSLIHPEDREMVQGTLEAAAEFGRRYQIEYRIVCRDGQVKWVLERGLAEQRSGGPPVIEGLVEDITERVQAQIELAEAELRYRSIFEHSEIGMYQTTEDGQYLAANQALSTLLGYSNPAELLAGLAARAGQFYVDPARRSDYRQQIRELGRVTGFESEVVREDGARIWVSEDAHAVYDTQGNFRCYEGTVVDVTERHRYEEQLEFQATHDVLTGLPNRNLLQDRLHQAIGLASRAGAKVALAFVDLDNFKVINDTLGHATGDLLLVAVAGRLVACLRETDTVARYGGDEFVLILMGQPGLSDIARTLERIQETVADPVVIGEHRLHVRASIGISVYPDDGEDLNLLLRHADAAMYHAKAEGKGRFAFYTGAFNRAVSERFAIETALRGALAGGEMRMHYQPRVNVAGRACGCEALLRWTHSSLGGLRPDRFIPLAEEMGLIHEITEFVLTTVCRDAAEWGGDAGLLPVAVNVSSRLFADGRLPQLVRNALRQSGLAANRLEIEVTESLLVGNIEHTAKQLRDLRGLGVRIALDDFGTGYSALSYLRKFPFDVLKVDRSFVTECDQCEDARALVRAIVSMGTALGLTVVAEGIERSSQLAELAAVGCAEFQGYLFAVPMPAQDIALWLRRNLAGARLDGPGTLPMPEGAKIRLQRVAEGGSE